MSGALLWLVGLLVLYVALMWLVEPYRPQWPPSLFGVRGAARCIRHRRFLNPERKR